MTLSKVVASSRYCAAVIRGKYSGPLFFGFERNRSRSQLGYLSLVTAIDKIEQKVLQMISTSIASPNVDPFSAPSV